MKTILKNAAWSFEIADQRPTERADPFPVFKRSSQDSKLDFDWGDPAIRYR